MSKDARNSLSLEEISKPLRISCARDGAMVVLYGRRGTGDIDWDCFGDGILVVVY